MSEESFEKKEESREIAKAAIELLPTEFRCIDAKVDGTDIGDVEIRLLELEPKIEAFVHGRAGNVIRVGTEATKEEVEEYLRLLKGKVDQYSALSNALRKLA